MSTSTVAASLTIEARKRFKKEANQERVRIDRAMARSSDFIVKGTATDALIPRMNELEAERKTLGARLEEAKERDNVIALHPKALDRYERRPPAPHATRRRE